MICGVYRHFFYGFWVNLNYLCTYRVCLYIDYICIVTYKPMLIVSRTVRLGNCRRTDLKKKTYIIIIVCIYYIIYHFTLSYFCNHRSHDLISSPPRPNYLCGLMLFDRESGSHLDCMYNSGNRHFEHCEQNTRNSHQTRLKKCNPI